MLAFFVTFVSGLASGWVGLVSVSQLAQLSALGLMIIVILGIVLENLTVPRPIAWIMAIFLLWTVWQFILVAYWGWDTSVLQRAAQLLLSLAAIASGWVLGVNITLSRRLWLFRIFLSVGLLLALTGYAALGIDGAYFRENLPGYYVLYMTPLALLLAGSSSRKICAGIVLIPIFLLAWFYAARAGILAACLLMVLYLARRLLISHWVFFFAPIIVVCGASVLALRYATAYGGQVMVALEIYSQSVFSRRLLTGREDLWGLALARFQESPWIGYGAQAQLSQFDQDIALSAHNLYLQTLIQNGIPGLVFLLCVFLALAIHFYRCRPATEAIVGYAFMLAVMLHQMTSVSLTQSTFATGVIAWSIMGLAGGMAASSVRRSLTTV